MNEYSVEKFIEQYEHIKKLQLLSDNELNQVKRKRAQFEVSLKSSKDIKSFIEYIKYESVLMKKFKQIEYANENDGRALDRAISNHIRDIYKQAVRRFPENRKMWNHYIEFAKIKYPNSVTSIYQQMLAFHHTGNDYMEAANYEMDKQNFYVAINFLCQGMSTDEKRSSKLVALHIECSLKQAEASNDEKYKEKTLIQVTKYFDKFIKSTKDVQIFIDLLNKIQHISFSMNFQNQIIQYILLVFCSRPEVWNLLADRHLDGLIFEESETTSNDIPFIIRLKHALTIYDKSLEMVDDKYKTQMYDLYLKKLMELEMIKTNIDEYAFEYIRYAFAKTLDLGYRNDCLSESFYNQYFKLCIIDDKKSFKEIEDIINKGLQLYPHSMEFYEITIKYYFKSQKYEDISLIFNQAIKHNDKNAIKMYRFLCQIYLQNSNDKDRLRKAMMEAIESNNLKLSAEFQPYILEYYAHSDSIKKAREIYFHILNSKSVVALSLQFFTTMIKLESIQLEPDRTIIFNCFERATKIFGTNYPDIWIEYIKYNWEIGKFSEAYSLKKRAIELMKGDFTVVEEFELKYTMLRNSLGMEDDIKEEML